MIIDILIWQVELLQLFLSFDDCNAFMLFSYHIQNVYEYVICLYPKTNNIFMLFNQIHKIIVIRLISFGYIVDHILFTPCSVSNCYNNSPRTVEPIIGLCMNSFFTILGEYIGN